MPNRTARPVASKRSALQQIFTSQLQRLAARGTNRAIIELLGGQALFVIQQALELSLTEKELAFLPVIPRTHMDIYHQMALVLNDVGEYGFTSYDVSGFYDTPGVATTIPVEPYYVLGVTLTDQSANRALDQNSLALVLTETIALATHLDTNPRWNWDNYGIWAPESRFKKPGCNPDQVPYLGQNSERKGPQIYLGPSTNDKRMFLPYCRARTHLLQSK